MTDDFIHVSALLSKQVVRSKQKGVLSGRSHRYPEALSACKKLCEIAFVNSIKTTDNLKEVFDIVDESDQIIGQATREECHSNPNLIHRSVFILVFNSKRELFLQKRSKTKDVCPGMWSVSVSGHVDHGETYDEAAIREMNEEIGVVADLRFLDKYIIHGETENEFSSIYRAVSNGPFHLDPVEIEKGGFFALDRIKKEIWSKLTPSSRTVLENLDEKGLLTV